MRGTLIAIEGITAANVGKHAAALVDTLTATDPTVVLGPQQRADLTGPLAERTAALLTLVGEQLALGKTVVVGPYIASVAAYRRAAGLYDVDDEHTEHTWRVLGLEPDLTLLLDAELRIDGRSPHDGPRQLAYHAAARDHLIRESGWHRTSWRVLPCRFDDELTAMEIRQHVEWMMHARQVRWPLEDHWRRPRLGTR